MLGSLKRGWNRLWFAPFDPCAAGVFRILTGLLTLAMYLALSWNWQRFFARDGILSLTTGGRAASDEWWSLFHWLDGRVPIEALLYLGILASLAFIAGYKTRLSTIVLFLLQASMIHRDRFIVNGEDLVLRMLLFYGCFAPLGRTLSVDAWLARRRPLSAAEPSSIWPIRLMQINLVLIYACSIPAKLTSDIAWLNGDVMYYVLINSTWSRWPWPHLIYHGWVSSLLTWTSLSAELTAVYLIWFRKMRVVVTLMMITFHLMIAIVLQNVTFFSLAMCCGLTVFIPGEVMREFLQKMRSTLFGKVVLTRT